MSQFNDNWEEIFRRHKISSHDFQKSPFPITAKELREATKREPYILCWQTSREERPEVFKKKGLFMLPVEKGKYNILYGEGYVDIEEIEEDVVCHPYNLPFSLDTAKVGNSEMQHLDFAYATGMLQHFVGDPSLLLTIRGLKSVKGDFTFRLRDWSEEKCITVKEVPMEVDGGYEGKNLVVLVEAKNSKTTNTIIRQLYYPFRKWKEHTKKEVLTLFFERRGDEYHFWEFVFDRKDDYNSIRLEKSARYKLFGSGV